MKKNEFDIEPIENPTSTDEKEMKGATSDASSQTEHGEELDPLSVLVPELSEQQEPIQEEASGSETNNIEANADEGQIIEPEKTLEDIIRREAVETETQSPNSFSLNRLLGGVLLERVFKNQIKLVLLITVFLIIYITCRYQCQQQQVEIFKLEEKLSSVKYKATVYTSQFTEKSRESNILEMLGKRGDSTLLIPTEPPYKINVPE